MDSFYPSPRRIKLAGEHYVARELQIRHLIRFNNWIVATLGDLNEQLDEMTAEERAEKLRAIYRPALLGKYSQGYGDPEGRELLFGTLEVSSLFLGSVLRHSKLSGENLEALADSLNDADWTKVSGVAWGDDPFDTITERIDSDLGIRVSFPATSDSGRSSWDQAIAAFSSRFMWASPREIKRLYISQFTAIASAGAKKERADRLTGKAAVDAEIQAKRAEFWKEFWNKVNKPLPVDMTKIKVLTRAETQDDVIGQ
jgi:hypothetical protein